MMDSPNLTRHTPVLRDEVLALLAPKSGESALDVTLGLGGHAEAILTATGPNGMLTGIDADGRNLASAKQRLSSFADRVHYIHANFRELPSLHLEPVDILLADVGLSSPHLDDPARGFSFRADGPLDMRFDTEHGRPASQLLADSTEDERTEIFRIYGELPRARTLARALEKAPVTRTQELVAVVQATYGWKAPAMMPQVFQALRIAVNDELNALQTLLTVGPILLKPGGRMAVISFHSLEDRLVKHVFRTLTTFERDEITGRRVGEPPFALLTRKPVRPSEAEVGVNPRARSALLRAVVRRV
jgi:16S rRNA (cytosine1402-N4)-methyltransferase